MIYNCFNSAIPYPSLNFGFSQTPTSYFNNMATDPQRDLTVEQPLDTQTDGNTDSVSAHPAHDDHAISDADMYGTTNSSLESMLHDSSGFHILSEVVDEQNQQHDLTTTSMTHERMGSSSMRSDRGLQSSVYGAEMAAPDSELSEVDRGNFINTDQSEFLPDSVHMETEAEASRPAQVISQDDSGVASVSEAPIRGRSPHVREIEPTKMTTSSDLSRYRPNPIPNFNPRTCSASPSRKDHRYSSMANWPPPDPELTRRIDVFPPKDAPLHVWIQAYALRWGVWLAEIKDETIRERVLAVVTEKMKGAWDTAIQEGYYLKPDQAEVQSDQERGESDAQAKRGRKRAQSPSKLSAGFACDGKDKFAISNGELAKHGITMEMINERVAAKDFDEGELRYDEVLQNMDSNYIQIKDWSASPFGMVANRNLLMYCFWIVQEERKHVARLITLLGKFNKEHQKKNTKARIDTVKEREQQHMALATELTISERGPKEASKAEEDVMEEFESTPVDSMDESGKDADHEAEFSGESVSEKMSRNDQLHELAHAIVSARNEAEVRQAFEIRSIQARDLTPMSGEVISQGLYEILLNLDQSQQLSEIMKSQPPSEAIKTTHEIRLRANRIGQVRSDITAALQNQSQPPHPGETVSVSVSVSSQHGDRSNEQFQVKSIPLNTSTGHSPIETVQSKRNDNETALETSESDSQPYDKPSGIGSSQQNHQQLIQQPELESRPIEGGPTTLPLATIKKLYIHERWMPYLNHLLTIRDLAPLPQALDSWNPIKDVLEYHLGMNRADRNIELRKFNEEFKKFCQEKRLVPVEARPNSPASSIAAQPSPAPSHASLPASLPSADWPTAADVIAAIPPQGILVTQLMHMFAQQGVTDQPRLVDIMKKVSVYDSSTKLLYLRPDLRSSVVSSNQISSDHGTSTSATAQNKVIKLKLPQNRPEGTPQLTRQDETNFPQEYTSKEVNTSRHFSFRHMSHARLEQRQRMDGVIYEYISANTKSRKKWGQYITFQDPEDPDGPAIAHGFWDMSNKGERAPGSEWFYVGENVPAEWSESGANEIESTPHASRPSQAYENASTPPQLDQTKLKLKFKTSKSGQGNGVGKPRAATPAAQPVPGSQQNFNPMQEPYQSGTGGNYHVVPPTYRHNSYPGAHIQQAAMQYPHTRQNGETATINPALLMRQSDQSNTYRPDVSSSTNTVEGQESNRRGTKRAASASKADSKKKKRRTNLIPDDDEEDEDYDPSQDY